MPTIDGFKIGHLTIIELTGADRGKILNNLCTQDLRNLQPGESKETFVLDPKGRTLALGIVATLPHATWFITVPNQAERLAPHFDRYIIREDALVQDISENWLASLLPPNSPWLDSPSASWINKEQNCQMDSNGENVQVTTQWIGAQSKLLFHKSSATQPAQFAPSDCSSRLGWEYERILHFWPWFGADLDEKNLPQELDIDSRTISFKKGCYLGQETVARLDALGQVQKKLCRIELSFPPDSPPISHLSLHGLELTLDEKPAGTITSVAPAPHSTQQFVGLAMIKRFAFPAINQLQLSNHATATIRRT